MNLTGALAATGRRWVLDGWDPVGERLDFDQPKVGPIDDRLRHRRQSGSTAPGYYVHPLIKADDSLRFSQILERYCELQAEEIRGGSWKISNSYWIEIHSPWALSISEIELEIFRITPSISSVHGYPEHLSENVSGGWRHRDDVEPIRSKNLKTSNFAKTIRL